MTELNHEQNIYSLDEIKLELSYKCHMNCIHCSSEGSRDKETSISPKKAKEIINSAATLKVKTISLSGGEPLLWNSFEELVKYLKTKNIKSKIYTSGTIDDFNDLLSLFSDENLTIIFSLYSGNPKIHDKITGIKGSFDRTKTAIQNSVENNIKSEIHYVPLSINYRDLRSIAELSRALGIQKVSVLRFVPQGRGANKDYLILNREQNIKLKNEIIALRNEGYRIRTGSPFNFLFTNKQPTCTSGMNKLIVAPNLSIYPCDAFKRISAQDFVGHDEYSSLIKHDLVECWSKSRYLALIRRIIDSELEEPCKSCSEKKSCRGGCLGQKVIHNNTFDFTCDPSCLMKIM